MKWKKFKTPETSNAVCNDTTATPHTPSQRYSRIASRVACAAGDVTWQEDLAAQNVSRERMRKSPLPDAIVRSPLLTRLRRELVPRVVRDRIKSFWQLRERPELSAPVRARVERAFDADLAVLGEWLGAELRCANFASAAAGRTLEWRAAP